MIVRRRCGQQLEFGPEGVLCRDAHRPLDRVCVLLFGIGGRDDGRPVDPNLGGDGCVAQRIDHLVFTGDAELHRGAVRRHLGGGFAVKRTGHALREVISRVRCFENHDFRRTHDASLLHRFVTAGRKARKDKDQTQKRQHPALFLHHLLSPFLIFTENLRMLLGFGFRGGQAQALECLRLVQAALRHVGAP